MFFPITVTTAVAVAVAEVTCKVQPRQELMELLHQLVLKGGTELWTIGGPCRHYGDGAMPWGGDDGMGQAGNFFLMYLDVNFQVTWKKLEMVRWSRSLFFFDDVWLETVTSQVVFWWAPRVDLICRSQDGAFWLWSDDTRCWPIKF